MSPWRPTVSVIMPVHNEADFMERVLGAVVAQDYPVELVDVTVVDGMSGDATRSIVTAMAAGALVSVALVDNPAQIVPIAMNLGLAATSGEVVVRVDGHCVIAPNYISRSIELLDQTGADAVGGVLQTIGMGLFGRAMALAQSTAFGAGDASFRVGVSEGTEVDTVPFGVYRRATLESIGGFDEELVRNQDDELNLRLRQAGGRLWLDPSVQATYYARSSPRRAWRQYHQYGFYKVRVMQKRRTVVSARSLAPAALVVGLGSTVAIGLATRRPLLGGVLLGPYLAAAAVASAREARRDLPAAALLPVVYPLLHVGYGVGFVQGALHWTRRAHRLPRNPATNELSVEPTERPSIEFRARYAGESKNDSEATAEREADRLSEVYAGYATHRGRQQKWRRDDPGNRSIEGERLAVLSSAVRAARSSCHPPAGDASPGAQPLRLVDLGCGSGVPLVEMARALAPGDRPVAPIGIELLVDRLPTVRPEPGANAGAVPGDSSPPGVASPTKANSSTAAFLAGNGVSLPVASGSVDVLMTFTVFSSIRDGEVRRQVAREIARVLAPGGVLCWYDLRVPSPTNRAVAPLTRRQVRALFPRFSGTLRPVTVVPPLARRLGRSTDRLYPQLSRVGVLHTHLAGALQKPDAS